MAFEQIVRGGGVLTQGFGQTAWAMACRCEWSCAGYAPGGFHAGIDIAAGYGAVLTSVGYGQVVRIGRSCPGCGCDGLGPYAVCVRSGPVDIWYGHAYKALVGAGQFVGPGTALSLMDSVGCSTGNHVHYEVLPAGADPNGCSALDPWAYVSRWPGLGPAPVIAPPPPPSSSSAAALVLLAGGAALLVAARSGRS